MNEKITFSIILPTRNRPEILPFSIESVLSQRYQNWELILIDNSDDNRTTKLITQYKDKRIRYYKTGDLSIHDNWEYGYKCVHGEYTLLLRDKDGLISGALDFLSNIIKIYAHPEMISWKHTHMHPITGTKAEMGTCFIEKVPSQMLIDDILSFEWKCFMWLAPQASILKTILIARLLDATPYRLWYGTATDVVIRYKIPLCNPDGFYHIHFPLSVELYPFDSIGNSFQKNEKTSLYLRSAGFHFEDTFKFVPIKHLSSLNLKYNDILMYDENYGDGTLKNRLDWKNYYREWAKSYWEIVLSYGIDSKEEQELKKSIMEHFPEFFETYTYPHWYGRFYWKLLKIFPQWNNIKNSLRDGIQKDLPVHARLSLMKLALFQVFYDNKMLIPLYSKYARRHVPISGNTQFMQQLIERCQSKKSES